MTQNQHADQDIELCGLFLFRNFILFYLLLQITQIRIIHNFYKEFHHYFEMRHMYFWS